ncbi:unnamed protein product [Protopolystoma xenopodis]|uniref:Uncharacterized protein n=1 Tax=Protopolystoma xenopodis TaxID=117903 RepID=A0A3S5A3E5_9PLAT|nr:unnamed protein product [Protopolystoma xenopodis]
MLFQRLRIITTPEEKPIYNDQSLVIVSSHEVEVLNGEEEKQDQQLTANETIYEYVDNSPGRQDVVSGPIVRDEPGQREPTSILNIASTPVHMQHYCTLLLPRRRMLPAQATFIPFLLQAVNGIGQIYSLISQLLSLFTLHLPHHLVIRDSSSSSPRPPQPPQPAS